MSGMPFHFRVFRIMLILLSFQRLDPMIGENEEPSETGAHGWASRDPGFRPNSHYYGQHHVAVPALEAGNEGYDHDLVSYLVQRFENFPRCFHLEWPPGVSPPDTIVDWIVQQTTEYSYAVGPYRPSALGNFRLTDCHCDLSGGNGSQDPSHVAYQEACLKCLKALVSRLEELCRSGAEAESTLWDLSEDFVSLTKSALLEHCRLDTGLLSLCWTFFELAKASPSFGIHSVDGEKGRENMLKWFAVRIFFQGSTPYRCDIEPKLTISLSYRPSQIHSMQSGKH